MNEGKLDRKVKVNFKRYWKLSACNRSVGGIDLFLPGNFSGETGCTMCR